MHNPKYYHIRANYSLETNKSDTAITPHQNTNHSFDFLARSTPNHYDNHYNVNQANHKHSPFQKHVNSASKVQPITENSEDLIQTKKTSPRSTMTKLINSSQQLSFLTPTSKHIETIMKHGASPFNVDLQQSDIFKKSQVDTSQSLDKSTMNMQPITSNLPDKIMKTEPPTKNLFKSPKSEYTGFLKIPKIKYGLHHSDLKRALTLYGIILKDKGIEIFPGEGSPTKPKKILSPRNMNSTDDSSKSLVMPPNSKDSQLYQDFKFPVQTYEDIKKHSTLIIFPEFMTSYDDLDQYWIDVNLYEYWKRYNHIFENCENIKYAHELYYSLLDKLSLKNNPSSYKEFLNKINQSNMLRLKTPQSVDVLKYKTAYLLEEERYDDIHKLFIETFMISDTFNDELQKQIKAEWSALFKLKYEKDLCIDTILFLDGKEFESVIELPPNIDVMMAGNKANIYDKVNFPKQVIQNFIKTNYNHTVMELIKEKWYLDNQVDKKTKYAKKLSPTRVQLLPKILTKKSPQRSRRAKRPSLEYAQIVERNETISEMQNISLVNSPPSAMKNSLFGAQKSYSPEAKNKEVTTPIKLNNTTTTTTNNNNNKNRTSSSPDQNRLTNMSSEKKNYTRRISETQTTVDSSRRSAGFRLPSLNVKFEESSPEKGKAMSLYAERFKYNARMKKLNYHHYFNQSNQMRELLKKNIQSDTPEMNENTLVSPLKSNGLPGLIKQNKIKSASENSGATVLKLEDIHEINQLHPELTRKNIYNIYSMFICLAAFSRKEFENEIEISSSNPLEANSQCNNTNNISKSNSLTISSNNHSSIKGSCNTNIIELTPNKKTYTEADEKQNSDSKYTQNGKDTDNLNGKMKKGEENNFNMKVLLNVFGESSKEVTLKDKISFDILFKNIDFFKTKSLEFSMEILRALEVPNDEWQAIDWEKFVELIALLIYKAANIQRQANFIINLFNPDNIPRIDKDTAFKRMRDIYKKSQLKEQKPDENQGKPEQIPKEKSKLTHDPIYAKFTKLWRSLYSCNCVNDKEELCFDRVRKVYEDGKADINLFYNFLFDDISSL